MAVAVKCGCGTVLWAQDKEGLLEKVDRHVETSHPELIGTLSPLELAGRPPAERAAA
jgi:hypothetical protein